MRAWCENSLFGVSIVLPSVRTVISGVRMVAFTFMYALESFGHFLGPTCRISISVQGCKKSYSRCGYSSIWCESGSFDLLII